MKTFLTLIDFDASIYSASCLAHPLDPGRLFSFSFVFLQALGFDSHLHQLCGFSARNRPGHLVGESIRTVRVRLRFIRQRFHQLAQASVSAAP